MIIQDILLGCSQPDIRQKNMFQGKLDNVLKAHLRTAIRSHGQLTKDGTR
jgi:hypothetical protein